MMIKFKVTIIACLILCMQNVFSQNKTITGQVTDSSGNTLPGVSVVIKGTTKGANTNFDGNYSLPGVSPNNELVFSYLGMNSLTILVGNKTKINVVLEDNLESLDEVIIVGYGSKKKSLVTGAISSVSSKDIKSVSNQRVEQIMQGRTSGVTVTSSSGSPGSGAKIRIRGTGSSGNAEPLFIVDGMKVSTMDNIAPSDIENMEILKDAASAAIYGTEGANGVVIITTKQGKEGGIKVNFNTQIGLQFVNTPMELMNASQFVTYMNEAGRTSRGETIVDNGVDTNWIDEVFDTAFMQRYDFNISGAVKNTSYYFSAGHTNQDGTVGNNSSFDRTSFRFNVKSKITDWLEIGVNSNTAIIRRKGIQENSDTRGVIQNALVLDPLTALIYGNDNEVPQRIIDNSLDSEGTKIPFLRDKNGSVYGYPTYSDGEVINPVAYANSGINNSLFKNDQSLTTAYLKFNIIEGLTFTSRYGYEHNQYYTKNTQNPYYVSSIATNSGYTFNDSTIKSKKWLWENFASYAKSIGNHNFKLLGGYSAEETRIPTLLSRTASTSISKFVSFDSLDAFDTVENQDNINQIEDNLVSMYGRLSYDYKEKYLFEASIRRDVSSKFPTANKAGVFPAFSAGWVASKEDFWSDEAFINTLKFRGSWGQNGSKANLPGNSDLTAVTTIGEGYQNQTIVYQGYTGAQISGFGNLNLVWETSEQIGFGVDLRALSNKLNFSADYYQKTTEDLIVLNGSLITPGSAGFNAEAFNGGTIVNSGLEFEVGYSDQIGDFNYSVNLNLSTLDNEVTEIAFVPEGTSLEGAGAPQNDDGITRFTEGLPAWYFYGYKTNGIDPATGKIIYAATGTTDTPSNAQKEFIGTPHADIMYGGNVKLGYKAFDLNVQFQGTSGNDIIATYHQPSRAVTNRPVHFFTERWTGAGDTNATMPGAGNELAAYQTDLVVEDGSYMRIKQIQFGYTLPSSFTDKLHIDNLRFYLSLDDYFTFTNYKGLDPEIGNFGFNDIGVDRGFYPTPARSLFGFSLNF